MAALGLQDRIALARGDNGTKFTNQVVGALVKHTKFIMRTSHPAHEMAFARDVLANPDVYAWRFGVALITEPVYDALEDANTLTDAQIQGTVAELWPLFVPPAPA